MTRLRTWSRATRIGGFALALVALGGLLLRSPAAFEVGGAGLGWIALATVLGCVAPAALGVLMGLGASRAVGRRRDARRAARGAAAVIALFAGSSAAAVLATRTIAPLAAFVIAAGVYALARPVLESRLRVGLHRDLRRRRRGLGGVRMTGLFAIGSAVTLVLFALGGLDRPADGARLRADPKPARRLVFLHFDGLGDDAVTYWTALRPRSFVAEIAEHGATARFAWDPEPSSRALEALVLGRPDRTAGVAPVRRLARTLALLVPRAESVPTDGRPALWDLVERAGRDAAVVGFPPALVGTPAPAVHVPDDAFARLRASDAGARALDDLHPATRARLRTFRDLARAPHEDWRSGTRATEAERRAAQWAARLETAPDLLWRDRFRLRVAARLVADRSIELLALHLDAIVTVAAAETPDDADDREAVEETSIAYLDALDPHLTALRRSLRAGDALALVFTPAPIVSGPAQGGPGVATILLFGEKIAPGGSVEVVEPEDVSATLRYLAGLPLSKELAGEPAWPLLTEGLAERIPPARVARYARVAR